MSLLQISKPTAARAAREMQRACACHPVSDAVISVAVLFRFTGEVHFDMSGLRIQSLHVSAIMEHLVNPSIVDIWL